MVEPKRAVAREVSIALKADASHALKNTCFGQTVRFCSCLKLPVFKLLFKAHSWGTISHTFGLLYKCLLFQ